MKLLLVLSVILVIAGTTTADQCQACKKIFNFISNVTHNGDDNLKGKLAELCSEYSYMPGKQARDWCLKSVDSFFNVMNKNLNTSTVCYDINACVDENDNGIRELLQENVEGKKEDCDFCIFVTTKVKEILSGGPTEIEIKTMLEDGCHYMGSFEKECLSMTDQYVDDLMTFINQSFQPKQMCKSLNVCAARTGPLSTINSVLLPSATDLANVLPLNVSLAPETEAQSPLSDINCDICKKIVKIIQAQLKDNATDQEIVNVLTEVCDLAPSGERQQCKTVVSDYTNRLIQVLTQDIDSNLACTMVGLCVPQSFLNYINGHFVNKSTEAPTVSKNAICVECQLLTHFIQNELYNYKNEEQIEEFLMNHFCKKVSWYINEQSCDTFIQQYGPIIMQTIAQEIFDPTTFCFKEIHVCPRTKVFSADFTMNKADDHRCQMCQDIVNNLNQVESNDLELDTLVEKACSHLPRAHSVECGLMMKAFAPYFFDVINHQDNAKEICKSIDICFIPGNVHLLGGHKCTFGPSYWCHTTAHADACNAHDYCRSKVWKPVN